MTVRFGHEGQVSIDKMPPVQIHVYLHDDQTHNSDDIRELALAVKEVKNLIVAGFNQLRDTMSELGDRIAAMDAGVSEKLAALGTSLSTAQTRISEDFQSLRDRLGQAGVTPEDLQALDSLAERTTAGLQGAVDALNAIDPDAENPNSV